METPPKEINVGQLLAKLEFSPDNCLNAAAINPLLFRDAIEFRIACLRKRNTAKMDLERAQADRELFFREEARNSGEKMTERNLEAKLLVDKAIQKFADKFSRAEEMDEYSKLVVEAFRMRRDALKIIGDLIRDDMSLSRALESGAERVQEARAMLKKRFPGT